MENLNDTKLNRMFNSAMGIHYLKQKGIDTSHLLPQTIHVRQDGSGLQVAFMKGGEINSRGDIIRLDDLYRETPIVEGSGLKHQEIKLLRDFGRRHYGGSIGGTRRSRKGSKHYGGSISSVLSGALVPTLINVAPQIVRGIGRVAKGEQSAKDALKQVGSVALNKYTDKVISEGAKSLLQPTKSKATGTSDSGGVMYDIGNPRGITNLN